MNKDEAERLILEIYDKISDGDDRMTLFNLIDRATETEPIKTEDIGLLNSYGNWCPNCKRRIHYAYTLLKENKFCSLCGQAVIWGDEEAIKQDTPQKPKLALGLSNGGFFTANHSHELRYIECPECRSVVGTKITVYGKSYIEGKKTWCDNCGQMIDWT